MIEQVAVVPAVYGAYGIEEPGVDLELFAAAEAGDKAVYYILLLGGELIGVGGVYGGKVGIPEGVYRVVYLYGAVFVVYAGEHIPVRHLVLRPAGYYLPLQLEQDHGDGLVHPGGQQLVLLAVPGLVAVGELDGELLDVAVLIDLVGKHRQDPGPEYRRIPVCDVAEHRQGQKVYAVGVFQHIHVVILYAVLYGDGHAHRAAGCRAHPQHVVVAPLYVHAVVAHEVVQNYVGVGAAVEYVADYVQGIHGHALYEGAQLRYESIRHAGVYYGADYVVVIGMFVVLVLWIEKLLHYVGKVLWQRLAHLGAGVL